MENARILIFKNESLLLPKADPQLSCHILTSSCILL